MLTAQIEAPGGLVADVHPGDLIGRSFRAALRLDNPKISEAHALVSLRGGKLKLLALRGALAVDNRRIREVELVPGRTVMLAEDLAVHVLQVSIPTHLLAARVGSGPAIPLMGSVQSLVGTPPFWHNGYHREARAAIWSNGADWLLRVGDAPPVSVTAGSSAVCGDKTVVFSEVATDGAGAISTIDAGRLHSPMHLVVRYHTAHIHRRGQPIVSLSGQPAVLLSELVALDGPTDWYVIARQIWRRHTRRDGLRRKLDCALLRLRQKLAAGGIRSDLIRADGTGHIEVVLYDGDRVEDLT